MAYSRISISKQCRQWLIYEDVKQMYCIHPVLKSHVTENYSSTILQSPRVSSAVHATSDNSGNREDKIEAQQSSSLSKQEEGQGNNASNGHIV